MEPNQSKINLLDERNAQKEDQAIGATCFKATYFANEWVQMEMVCILFNWGGAFLDSVLGQVQFLQAIRRTGCKITSFNTEIPADIGRTFEVAAR